MARRDDIDLDVDISGFQRSLDDRGRRALRVQPEAHDKPKFDYDGVISSAFRINTSQTDFARNRGKEIAYRLEKAGNRPSTSNSVATPGFRRPSWFKG